MKFLISLAFILFSFSYIISQTTISSGRLSITVENLGNGAKVTHIKDNSTETLNTSTTSEFFTLTIRNTNNSNDYNINSFSGWNNVNISSTSSNCTIQFSNPASGNLPASLTATVTINTNDAKSDWDLSVAGLDANHSLMDAIFPKLNIETSGNDTIMLPYYSGKLVSNPGSGIDYSGLYPRGWTASMQFEAYYNAQRAMYFGFHDPGATLKTFVVNAQNGGVEIECQYPSPDKTIAGNNWSLPGVFELDAFDGDWYDASIIYKDWASNNANYWPALNTEKVSRLHEIGEIGAWSYSYVSDGDMNLIKTLIETFANFMEVPVGVHLNEWNYKDFDDDYPDYFPERSGFSTMINDVQTNNDVYAVPYINGRLFDTDLPGYDVDGLPYATKKPDGSIYSQNFNNNTFAVMCPTQTHWQDTLIDAADQLTDRIGTYGVYIDQVTAAGPKECMDNTHGHSLGGGNFWREGYNEMFERIHNKIPSGRFINSESGCDFLADEVDGFLVEGWTTTGQVPAFSVVYAGRNIMFGTKTGTSHYGDQQFYAKLAMGFIFGFQPGRQSSWLFMNLANASPTKKMAANYIKRLGKMRYKLRKFMSYGKMLHPLNLTGEIPYLTYTIYDYGTPETATRPAVQNSVWQNGDSVVVLLVNASLPDVPNVIDDSLSVSFSFNGADYGLTGALAVTELTDTSESRTVYLPNTFNQIVNIRSISPKAYLIRPASDLGNIYYVSTTGNDANSGTSEALAWRTISYAASSSSPVQAGDIVYIKAGNYGAENIDFQKSGTAVLPILFEGYQNTPGDNPNTNHSFGDALDATVMPLLDGGDRTTAGGAFEYNNNYFVSLRNIQITNYNYGIYTYGSSNLTFDNIIISELGDVNDSYDGTGLSINADNNGDFGEYNTVKNCFVENAAAEGYSFDGNYNTIENSKVYCDEDTDSAAMDYYIVFGGNYNKIENCYAERIGVLDHDGHGIGFKGNCEYNTVKNSTAKNLGGGFYVRHRACKFNTFENCKAYDLYGFAIRDGASYNTFRNCEAIDNESAVLFYDTDEDGGAQYTGRNNIFENCIFRNTSENVIDFFYYELESICDSNIFQNCVIDSGDYLFNCDRSNQDNKLVNCIVTNVNNYSRTAYHQDNSYTLNVILENTDFYNNGFAAPSGTNITTFDPNFVDVANHDYHLQSTSQCINAGNNYESPDADKEGNPRPLMDTVDLGVYEFGIYWTGFKGNHWRNAANWSNNQIPTSANKVTIPSPKYYYNRPEVHDNSQVKTLYLFGNGQMMIKDNVVFDVLE